MADLIKVLVLALTLGLVSCKEYKPYYTCYSEGSVIYMGYKNLTYMGEAPGDLYYYTLPNGKQFIGNCTWEVG